MDALYGKVSNALKLTDSIYLNGSVDNNFESYYTATGDVTLAYWPSGDSSTLCIPYVSSVASVKRSDISTFAVTKSTSTTDIRNTLAGKYTVANTNPLTCGSSDAAKDSFITELSRGGQVVLLITSSTNITSTTSSGTVVLTAKSVSYSRYRLKNPSINISSRSVVSGGLGNSGLISGMTIYRIYTAATGSVSTTSPAHPVIVTFPVPISVLLIEFGETLLTNNNSAVSEVRGGAIPIDTATIPIVGVHSEMSVATVRQTSIPHTADYYGSALYVYIARSEDCKSFAFFVVDRSTNYYVPNNGCTTFGIAKTS